MSEEAQNHQEPDDAPAWLDAGFIQDAVRRSSPSDAAARVQSISTARATAPGDHYASVIYRVKATLADGGERVLLVKTLPKGDALAKAVVESGLFRYETSMLAKHVPIMHGLLDTVCPGRFQAFAARCFLHSLTPEPFLVLEDLKLQGFSLAVRHRGLGLRHCLLAIRTLARFHAASAALLEKDPSVAQEYTNFFKTCCETWEPFMTSSLQLSADACRKWPGFENYADILEKYKENALEILGSINDPIPGKFNVILHGDFWVNNMMFKYNKSGQPIDFRMVDLQLSHVASPAIDLLYFLSTSLSDDVSENHERLLLREYHVALTESLDYFGMRGPSFKEMMEDLDTHSAYTFFGAFCVWPVVRAEAVPDLNASLKGDSSKSNFMYEHENTKKWMQRVLQEYDRRGWLQFLKQK